MLDGKADIRINEMMKTFTTNGMLMAL